MESGTSKSTCKVCGNTAYPAFKEKILNKYEVQYYACPECEYLFTEKPYWLNEAYNEAINASDTGLVSRNIHLSRLVCVLIFFFYNRKGKFVDYAGGYGLFTRLMRDAGFDFYWSDLYCTNLFAVGFENNKSEPGKAEIVTAFEVFEHLVDPIAELKNMMDIASTIIFSTELLPERIPEKNWWYYGYEHGQHISFYSIKTLKVLAGRFSFRFYSLGGLHIFTKRKLPVFLVKVLFILSKVGRCIFIKKRMGSKILEDHLLLKRTGRSEII